MPRELPQCEGCSIEFRAKSLKTKFCRGCRLLAQVTEADKNDSAEWLYECRSCAEPGCNNRFWPLRPTYLLCYSCMDPRAFNRRDQSRCTHCQQHNQSAPGYLPVHKTAQCEACVQRSFVARHNYFNRLFELRDHRRDCSAHVWGQFQTDETMPERPRTTTAQPAPITGTPVPPPKQPIPSEYRRAITNKADLERLLNNGHEHYRDRYNIAAQKLKLLTEQYGPSSDYLWV